MKKIFIISIFAACFNAAFTQMTTTVLPPLQVAQTLVGSGVTISNVVYTGDPNALGIFSINGPTNLGMNQGVVMTTGTVLNNGNGPHGPNNSTGSGEDNGQPGDPYLTSIAGANTFNRAILEFDFIPVGDTVKFEYVFGTEEYMEWITGGFADVFAFVLSGVTTPLSPVNIALIPNTSTPVTALNVNANVNPQYYVDNENPPGQTVQYDGFTTVLTAKHHVICGETYHLKMMIADALDGVVDAGVFIKAGSLSSNSISITAASVTGGSTIAEGCGAAVFTFTRPDTTGNFWINFNVGGTATPGSDYSPVPDSIMIPSGQNSTTLLINAFTDGVPEGQETVTFFIIYNNGCGNDTVQATIYIDNVEPITLTVGPGAEICTANGESAPLSVTATGGYGPYTYVWSNNAGTTPNVTVSPATTTSYTVTVTDTCNNSTTSAPIEIVVLCDMLIPNVFSPNEDGVNDAFFIINLEQWPGTKVEIYNRWGSLVYMKENYQNDWKGTHYKSGAKLADGVYYYVVTEPGGKQGPFNGTVTIFR